jgi:hypothetical protein
MSSVPDGLRQQLRDRLWRLADELGWRHLPAAEKSRWYGIWAESDEIGKKLHGFIDPLKTRVYIKDTLLKDYQRSAISDPRTPLLYLGFDPGEVVVVRTFEKPYGLQVGQNLLVAWGKAADWKAVLMAVHERAFVAKGIPYGAVMLEAGARFQSEQERAVVKSASDLLGIRHLAWVD